MENKTLSNLVKEVRLHLHSQINSSPDKIARFFKTGRGGYAEVDQFIGVAVPQIRATAKAFIHLSLLEIQELLTSPINEERLLALLILVLQYKKGRENIKEKIYQFYLDNLQYVNNWNLVDSSAHWIVGAHLEKKNKDILLKLAQSSILWERRVAIVATWYFIRQNDLTWTLQVAHMLLEDGHDLIHKAVGWMLREAGKRDGAVLVNFLDEHAAKMPRTMLRYAIEKLSVEQKKAYLLKKRNSYLLI